MTGRRLTSMLSMLLICAALVGAHPGEAPLKIAVSFGPELSREPLCGRLLLLLSADDSAEPRFQISDTGLRSQQVFGIDVEGLKPGEERIFDSGVLGYPAGSFDGLRADCITPASLRHRDLPVPLAQKGTRFR